MQQLSALLKAEGISGLSVGDIARRLRCSRRRLYQLAPTKEGLLLLVAQAVFDAALRAGFEAASRETEPARVIAAYMEAGVSTAGTLSSAFHKDLEASEEGRASFDRYQTARARGFRQVINGCIERGDFRVHNPAVAVEVLFGAAQRLRRPEFLDEAGLTLRQAFEEAYNLILDGLLARPDDAHARGDSRPLGRHSESRPRAPERARKATDIRKTRTA